jgi:hypothetical protein
VVQRFRKLSNIQNDDDDDDDDCTSRPYTSRTVGRLREVEELILGRCKNAWDVSGFTIGGSINVCS